MIVSGSENKQIFQFQDNLILNKQDNSSQLQNNFKKQKVRIPLITKLSIVAIFFAFFLIYKIQHVKYKQDICVLDEYHQLTFSANRKMYNGWDNTIIGVGQFLMDGWIIFIMLYWLFKSKNMRFPSAIAAYFAFRALMLNLQRFPFPNDIVWHAIPIPAVTVPYDHTRDFYYSGHTGSLTLILFQLLEIKSKYLAIACTVSLFYMVNMLTISRIHYSIDIIGAIIFAPFWFRFVRINLKTFDYLFSIPFFVYKFLINMLCGNYQNEGQQEEQEHGNQMASKQMPEQKMKDQGDNKLEYREDEISQNKDDFSQFQMKTVYDQVKIDINQQQWPKQKQFSLQ